MTFLIGNAIKEGGEKALEMWANEERPVYLDTPIGRIRPRLQIRKPGT
jgi:hypothetical protein